MSKFSIETVKWKWAEAVQSKHIYRDDEFIRTATKEEALAASDYLLSKPKGLTYTITVFRDGEYFTYYRHSMPCYGGLVKYRDSHGDKYYMNPYFPRDIYVAFPEGDIIFIGIHASGLKNVLATEYGEFVLSSESPWVSAFNSKDNLFIKNNHFVLTDMNTDPTVLYSLLRLGGLGSGIYGGVNKNVNPKAAILSLAVSRADPRRLAGQKPIKTSGGTWAEGYGYTRPYNEFIFVTKLPHKLKDFKKLSGYPKAVYDPKYFIDTMKKKFKVDVSCLNLQDKKTVEALVESWDFFKKEAEKLKDDD